MSKSKQKQEDLKKQVQVETVAEEVVAAQEGDILSEVKENNPYHVIYDDNQTASEKARWYVVHTYSGHELKVAEQLKIRIESMGIKGKIFECLIPAQDKIQVKKGQKKTIKEKILPGYIMIKMIVDDQSWLAVRTTQGVTAFIGSIGRRPTPISEKEVQAIMKFIATEQPKFKSQFTLGEAVKIIEGPFSEFLGTVDSIDESKGKIHVLVSIFGRETPVELEFSQVAKI